MKQKSHKFTPKCQQAINDKVDMLLEVRFIVEVQYPQWFVNIVLVKKSNKN